MSEIKHATIRESTEQADGTVSITTRSYTEKLSSVKTEVERRHPTSANTLFKDLLSCTDVLKETEELTLTIVKKHGQPHLIRQTYIIGREYHGK
jgi:hypothetical protein